MADDETIVIRVNAAQGEAALRALGKAGIEAGQGIEKIGPAASGVDLNLKDLTRNIGAGISLISILRDNLEALKPALDKVGEGIKFAAVQAGANSETVSNLGLAFDSLIHPSHIAANAVESLGRAWGKLEEAIVGSSEVIPHGVRTIEQSLTALAAARKAAASVQEEALTGEQAALAATAKEEKALEEAALKSSAARSKAEAEAAQVIIEALAAQREQYKAFLEETAKFVAEQDAILAKPNQGFDNSQDATEAKASLAGLNQQIKAIQDNPIITEDQDQQLRDLTRQARAAKDEVRSMSQVFTLSAMNGEELAAKQNAAWSKYYALRHANDAMVQQNVDDDLRALGEQNDAVGDLSDSAEGAADAFSDLADAAGSLGDESKKGADKAGEGIDKLKEGLTEALPLAEQLRTVLQDIVAIAASADI